MNTKMMLQKSIAMLPLVEGPIPCSDTSHPFCAMAYSRVPLQLVEYGYIEEEFFLESTVNVYDVDSNNDPIILKTDMPYKNRILVRKPADMSKFSGRVYVDILNATQNYDIEDLWHRIYLWCMENGHGYVGITSKPVNVMSLKYFDFERYESLNWSSDKAVPQPAVLRYSTIPGTEEGLFWDMLGQLANLLKNGEKNNCFGGAAIKHLYLTGQSQSGAYLNTYINYFDRYATDLNGDKLFDGYFNIAGALVQREIKQEQTIEPLKLVGRNVRPTDVPFISVSCEGDLTLFNLFFEGDLLAFKIPNKDLADDKCRYYEIAGAPHTDIVCPVLTDIEEIKKTKAQLPNLDEKLLHTLNDFPTEYYLCGLLEKLHIWASAGIAPKVVEPFNRENNALCKDVHNNIVGGLRSPFVDVPIATYIASNPDDPEGISGKIIYFSKEKFLSLYGSAQYYLHKFASYTDAQVQDGWISTTDACKMKAWSEEAVRKVLSE